MNANLLPKTPIIKDWLQNAIDILQSADVRSAHLDAEIILAHTINKPRTYLHAHPETIIDSRSREIADARIDLRSDRVPVAYIIGHKEFYGRNFKVTPDTLIPRPESEAIIELLKKHLKDPRGQLKLCDVGCGSGVLGITAKKEFPQLKVSLADISQPALEVAEQNAEALNTEVELIKSNLCDNVFVPQNIMLANLPYVDTNWEVSTDAKHEPENALFADQNGLELIKKLLDQSTDKLSPNGLLIIEADACQHPDVTDYAQSKGLSLIDSDGIALAYSKN
jgi:release factor glutamine methyltransferase